MTKKFNGLTKNMAFEQTLNDMNEIFTSFEFGKYLRINGFTMRNKGGSDIGDFLKLKSKTVLRISRNTWKKKYSFEKLSEKDDSDCIYPQVTDDLDVPSISSVINQLSNNTIIEEMRKRGYIVFKA